MNEYQNCMFFFIKCSGKSFNILCIFSLLKSIIQYVSNNENIENIQRTKLVCIMHNTNYIILLQHFSARSFVSKSSNHDIAYAQSKLTVRSTSYPCLSLMIIFQRTTFKLNFLLENS